MDTWFFIWAITLGLALLWTIWKKHSATTLVIENPEPHHLADPQYLGVILDGQWRYFTAEALNVAQQRAERLKA
jgi:hypothetical protein